MALAHLAVAGVVEGVLTAGVIAYLQRANLPVLRLNHPGPDDGSSAQTGTVRPPSFTWRWSAIGLGTMAVLTPLGLIAPGGAFGEDAPSDLDLEKYKLSSVPEGLRSYAGWWHHAIFDGYGFSNESHPVLAYLVSAAVGIAVISLVIGAIFLIIGRLRSKPGRVGGMTGAKMTVTATRPVTPDWLITSQVGLCPCGCIGRRKPGSFIDRTIGGGAALMQNALFSDDLSKRSGLLQSVEPRVKVVTMLGLLVTVSLVHHIPLLAAMYVGTLGLAAMSALPIGFFIKRVWLFIPIFTGVVVVPAMFSFITPGHIAVPLGRWFGHDVGLTSQGLTSAGLIVTRVATSISVVVLLTLTTPWTKLLAALRTLGVPRMFIQVLGMAYRYLFHLLDSVTEMYTARKARTVGTDEGVASRRVFVAASAGAMFGKAHALSTEVHMAMVSRGYTGEARFIQVSAPGRQDLCWAVASVLTAVGVIGVDRVLLG